MNRREAKVFMQEGRIEVFYRLLPKRLLLFADI